MESNNEQQSAGDKEIDDSPIEQVRLTVPITDDPTLPVLTFRTWVLGPITCVFLSLFYQLSRLRTVPALIPVQLFTVLFIPAGKLMAAKLPTRPITIPYTRWSFSMNPGPFNIKEHVLLNILATSSPGDSELVSYLIVVTKAFFHKNVSIWATFILVLTSQMMGYGIAGIFKKLLVENPYMWWPSCLLDVSNYRMYHEVDVRPKGKLTRIQFFIIVSAMSFAYSIIPNHFFHSIVALSFVCWIWKDSITAQQIGSARHGLGIGSFTLDWSSITAYAGDPLVLPWFTIVNMMVGMILVTFILGPIGYWTNSYGAKRFPIISNDSFDVNGQVYNVSRILDDDLALNKKAYNDYSLMYLSIFMLYGIGFVLASEAATVTYFILYYARDTWNEYKQGHKPGRKLSDIHNRLMRKYATIPNWWFYSIIATTLVLALVNSTIFGKQFQLPYWAVLLGYSLPFILILPVGIIEATTGKHAISMAFLSQLIIGWIYPGNPIASLSFESYASATMGNSITFLSDFKIAHYLKIPPRSMFIAQAVGSFIASSANFFMLWWILSTVDNICDQTKLPEGSPWTCPLAHMMFTRSMVWGAIGPARMLSPAGQYSKMYVFIIIGVISTILMWAIMRVFHKIKWVKLINVPVILMSASMFPPSSPMFYWALFAIALFFKLVVYRKYPEWWAKYNYALSVGMSMGSGIAAGIGAVALRNVYGIQWWGMSYDDHCPLATCPTAPGVKVDGCPVF